MILRIQPTNHPLMVLFLSSEHLQLLASSRQRQQVTLAEARKIVAERPLAGSHGENPSADRKIGTLAELHEHIKRRNRSWQ